VDVTGILSPEVEEEGEPSTYHRALLATTIPHVERIVPLSASEQQSLWPTWWNATLEERLQEEILIGIVTTRYGNEMDVRGEGPICESKHGQRHRGLVAALPLR